ncbi:hypothetical protein FACUT_9380 [Fusarium acutatum]|uniref:Uncharacterized protein n=1 Tax=Fusarium acutatum TaxID=78861 RepID=A0A8H4JI89_9HYPO|nr:hypothetical protein FACUT_9380 [Fusarium acutatum]
MVALTDLTRPLTIPTKVPAPARDGELKWAASGNESPTLDIVTCSEFVEYAAPVQHFSSKHKFKAIQGFQQEPTLFAIGDSGELNVLIHEQGVSSGWTLHSISPSSAKVVSFDAIDIHDVQTAKLGIYLAATISDANNASKLYFAFLPVAALKAEEGSGSSIWKNIPWVEIPDPQGPKAITSLLLGVVKNRPAGCSPLVLFVGTQLHGEKAATFYAVDLTPGLHDPWTLFSPATEADIVVDIQPASLKAEDGVFVLTRKGIQASTECLFYELDPTGLDLVKTSIKRIATAALGRIQAITTSRTWLGTDLIVACEKGVGFINHRYPTSPPLQAKGLPSISFCDVVCSEEVNPSKKTETCISIYAVSNAGELYFIQGSRKWSTNGAIELWSSGLPIRNNISKITCRYNTKVRSSQLIYTNDASSTLKYLLRDSDTGYWSDASISFAAPQQVSTYNAFVSTISIRDTRGRSVGQGFPVAIASISTSVLVNERSYTLSEQVTRVITNDQGQIVVVAAAMDSMKAPTYTIHISHEGIGHLATIEAGQRLVRLLSEVNSIDSIINAKSTTGELIFDKKMFDDKNQELQESVGLLQQFPALVEKVSSPTTTSGTDFIQLASGDRDGGFLNIIGDALEWIRNTTKSAVKLIIKPVLKGIKIALQFLDKVIDVVVDSVGPLIDLLGTVMKNKLGFDFNDIFKWLGLTFDNDKTKKNQMVLEKSITTALSLPGEITRGTEKDLERMFERIEANMEPLLGHRNPISIPDQEDPHAALRRSPLAWLFDNPVVNMIMRFNPVSVILDALSESFDEELGGFVQIPNIFSHFRKAFGTLGHVAEKQSDLFLDLLTRFWDRIKDFVSQPSRILELLKDGFQDFFRTIFDAIKTLITGLWESVGQFMDGLLSFINDKWKIPILTRLFKWYTDQDFTLMNLFTFAVTRILGLIVGEDQVHYFLNFSETLDEMIAVVKSGNIFSFGGSSMMTHAVNFSAVTTNRLQVDAQVASPFALSMLQTNTDLSAHASDPSKNSARHGSDHDTHHLSKEAKHRIHKFESWAKGITSIVGGFRFLAVVMESQQLLADEAEHGTGPLVSISLSATAVWKAKDHKLSKACSFGATVCVTIGTFSEVIALHIVPGWNEEGPGSGTARVSQFVELLASGLGFASCLCAPFPPTKGAAPILSVGDGIGSLVSVALTVVSATAPGDEDDKFKEKAEQWLDNNGQLYMITGFVTVVNASCHVTNSGFSGVDFDISITQALEAVILGVGGVPVELPSISAEWRNQSDKFVA